MIVHFKYNYFPPSSLDNKTYLAQLNWTYYSLLGRPHRIEMYHGDESGHLILFVNGQIIQIEFNQKETKKFSFVIDSQVIELAIKAENGLYDYTLTPQRPPAVEDVEKTFDKHFWIPLIFFLLILNLAFYLIKNVYLG